jgi:hypothetical protein
MFVWLSTNILGTWNYVAVVGVVLVIIIIIFISIIIKSVISDLLRQLWEPPTSLKVITVDVIDPTPFFREP